MDVKLRMHAGKYIPVLVYPDSTEYQLAPGLISEDAGRIAHELRRWRKAWASAQLGRIAELASGEFNDTDELLELIHRIATS